MNTDVRAAEPAGVPLDHVGGSPAPRRVGEVTTPRYDVVVVGGGVIGLASAWRIAQRGLRVAVVDPRPGQGASWVAAGMLAPISEVHYGEEPLLALAVASARRWPAFAAELATVARRAVGYRSCGTLVVAADDDDRAWAHELLRFQNALELDATWLTRRQVRELEPALAPTVRGAILAAQDHQVDNRLLVGALLEAARHAGVDMRDERATALEVHGGAVSGVRLAGGATLRTSAVVLAAGCWSGDVEGIPPGAVPPVRPVKGQILRLLPSERSPVLNTTVRGIVHGASVYLVPRLDGTVVVGATVEDLGFDTTVTGGAIYELLRDAHRVVPGVTEMVLGEASAGLRPGSPDNAPIVGPVPGLGADGLVIATGHYRQGILLAPVTASAVAAYVAGDDVAADMAPFTPARFATATTGATR